MIADMVKECSIGLMGQSMKGILQTAKLMEEEGLSMQMERFMMEIGR